MGQDELRDEPDVNFVGFVAPYIAYFAVGVGALAIFMKYELPFNRFGVGLILLSLAVVGLGHQIRKDGTRR